MQLLSVNVGQPQEMLWKGRTIVSAIHKTAVANPVRVHTLGLAGDAQADRKVHGGPDKAVYLYPAEHYDAWREALGPDIPGGLPWGAFGENLSTTGLDERSVAIGDRFRIGTAELRVTQPRLPCTKLAARFDRPELGKAFLESARTGFYLAVDQEGELAAGDDIALLGRGADPVSVADVVSLYRHADEQPELLRRVVELPELPESWREYFRGRLE